MGCCSKQIFEIQSDFKAQKSLVQEVIKNAGHLCIFLPKFYYELNFIEFFWQKVKKYIQDYYDCTFKTLPNLPSVLASIELKTIKVWEHRMHHWMAAY